MSTAARSRQAASAAEPVSPEVAPTIVTCSPPPLQHRVEHLPDELQRQILEGEGRPVKQLEEPQPLVDLHQRRHRPMPEPLIRSFRQRTKPGRRKCVAGEEPDDPGSNLSIGKAGIAAQGFGIERRQPIRHIEPAILGEARQQHRLERQGAGQSPRVAGAQVLHKSGPINPPGTYRRSLAAATRRLARAGGAVRPSALGKEIVR